MATLTYLTGFEHGVSPVASGGGLAVATGGTAPTVQGAVKRTGSYSLKATGDTGVNYWQSPSLGTGNITVASAYIRIDTMPATGNMGVFSIGNAALGQFGAFVVDSSSVLWAKLDVTTQGLTGATQSGPTLSTATWYRIDCRWDASGATWTLDWKVDGVAKTQVSQGAHASDVTAKSLVCTSDPRAGTITGSAVYFDDLAASQTTGDYPLAVDAVEGVTADQAAAASHVGATLTGWAYTDNNFTGTTGITTNNETASRSRVNVLGDANHGVQNSSASPAGNLQYPIADPANTGVPIAVQCLIAVKESGTGTNNATMRTNLSGTSTNVFSGNPGTTAPWNTFSGTTLGYLKATMATAPGGTAWTLQKTKDMVFEFVSTDGNPNPRLMGFYYEIAFPAPSGSTYTKAGFAKENA